MTARPINIMIVDDHVVIRSGLRMLIEHDQRMRVVAQAGNRVEALERAAAEKPDVIILDLLLGDDDGLAFLPSCQASPDSRVLVLTNAKPGRAPPRHTSRRDGDRAERSRRRSASESHHEGYEGEVWIERSMMGSMIQEFTKPTMADPEAAKIESLTDREREVISLIGEGLKNKQVGERLFISETTVTHHLSSVFSKLDVSDRLELIIYAFRHGLAKIPASRMAESPILYSLFSS